MSKKRFTFPSSYTILLFLIFIVAFITLLIPGVKDATIAQVFMAPAKGFADAIDICLFVLIIGGFLGVVTETGALDKGIASVVKMMKGKELYLIPVLMALFSLGGTTYGMMEETVAFYALICSAMIAAKMDSMVGAATVLLGAGSGVLGSTVNPFSTGAAIDALQKSYPNIVVDQTIIIGLGCVLWLSTLAVCIVFVMRYAKMVKDDPSKTILSKAELDASNAEFKNDDMDKDIVLTGRMKLVLYIFAFTFIIMIVSLIPWMKFGVDIFANTAWLTGKPLGDWYFQELQSWFFYMAVIAGLAYGLKEMRIVNSFIAGAADMVGVALIVAIARGISVLLSETGMDTYILNNAASMLQGISSTAFAAASYVIYALLTFLIPSSSGLAAVSIPTFGGLTYQLGLSPEVMIMIFASSHGFILLFTPTNGAIMGGLAIAKVGYGTWLKFSAKLLACILILNIIIVSIAMSVIHI